VSDELVVGGSKGSSDGHGVRQILWASWTMCLFSPLCVNVCKSECTGCLVMALVCEHVNVPTHTPCVYSYV
jgi:hypothetical protein